MSVRLPPGFTDTHKVIARRLIQGETLPYTEQALLFETFDQLHQAQVLTPTGWQNFPSVYERLIEERFANAYLQELLQTQDIATAAEPLRAEVSSQIMPALKQANLIGPEDPLSFYLLAYCLYWWYAFARGYAFEIEVFRDLDRSGIYYRAHNLLDASERRSPFDLAVLGFRGDVKTSTYFLHLARTPGLLHDFYITRVHTTQKHRYTWLVFLQELAWKAIQGRNRSIVLVTFDELVSALPGVFRLQTDKLTLVVLDYPAWKQRVLNVQNRKMKNE